MMRDWLVGGVLWIAAAGCGSVDAVSGLGEGATTTVSSVSEAYGKWAASERSRL